MSGSLSTVHCTKCVALQLSSLLIALYRVCARHHGTGEATLVFIKTKITGTKLLLCPGASVDY